MEKEIFQIAHDQLGHVGYLRTRERLNGKVYIFDLDRKLRSRLFHCRECMVNATRRHKLYGSLQPNYRHQNFSILLILILYLPYLK